MARQPRADRDDALNLRFGVRKMMLGNAPQLRIAPRVPMALVNAALCRRKSYRLWQDGDEVLQRINNARINGAFARIRQVIGDLKLRLPRS